MLPIINKNICILYGIIFIIITIVIIISGKFAIVCEDSELKSFTISDTVCINHDIEKSFLFVATDCENLIFYINGNKVMCDTITSILITSDNCNELKLYYKNKQIY